MKAVIVGNANLRIDNISAAQLDPFFRNRDRLRKALGLKFQHIQAVSLAEIEQACRNIASNIDVLFIRPDWRENPQDVTKALRRIRNLNANRKIFFIDPWDQVSSRFFGVLPYVDRLLKYQRLKNVADYRKTWIGGTVITDYLVKEWGYDLHGWDVSSEVPAGYENRIATGWSVVTAKRFEKVLFPPMLQRIQQFKLQRKPKDIDIFCHLSYSSPDGEDDWYTAYRKASVKKVQSLGDKFKLAVSGEYPGARTVSSKQYMDDLERSKIVFSPFGWGEMTWRDYEAVCHGCLLIKPSMDHVDISPNIYYANETYVPVQWDFADLEEKCDFYLKNPDEAARIITNARRTLEAYFLQDGFVKTIGDLINDQEKVPTSNSLQVQSPTTSRVA